MFDISWSELLILGVVTLIFVGPKELPVFLRTIGRYAGMVKRQAGEFRAQFDEAMRDAELDQLKKEFETARDDVSKTFRDTEKSVEKELADAEREFNKEAASSTLSAEPDPFATDADAGSKPDAGGEQPSPPAPRSTAPATGGQDVAAKDTPKAGETLSALSTAPAGEVITAGAPGSVFRPVPPFGKGV